MCYALGENKIKKELASTWKLYAVFLRFLLIPSRNDSLIECQLISVCISFAAVDPPISLVAIR